jgi:hypothetical protein
MAGPIVPRGKNVWRVRVYLGTDPNIGSRASSIRRSIPRDRFSV